MITQVWGHHERADPSAKLGVIPIGEQWQVTWGCRRSWASGEDRWTGVSAAVGAAGRPSRAQREREAAHRGTVECRGQGPGWEGRQTGCGLSLRSEVRGKGVVNNA